MRYIICYEGKEMVPNQFIVKDALKVEDEIITISWNFNFTDPPIGEATDIQHEDDGALTAEIKLYDEFQNAWLKGQAEIPEEYSFSIYMVNAYYHRWKDILWVTDATIKGVAIIPHAWWPHFSKGASHGKEA